MESKLEIIAEENQPTILTSILNIQKNNSQYNIITKEDRFDTSSLEHYIEFLVIPTDKLKSIQELNVWLNVFKKEIGIKDEDKSEYHQDEFEIYKHCPLFFKGEYFLWTPLTVIDEFLPVNKKIITTKELTIKDQYILDNNVNLFKKEQSVKIISTKKAKHKTIQIINHRTKEHLRQIVIEYNINKKLPEMYNFPGACHSLKEINKVLNEEEINTLFLTNKREKKDIKKQIQNYNKESKIEKSDAKYSL